MQSSREADDPLVTEVIGAAIAVHKALGPGYSERIYEEALAIEFAHRCIPFSRQHRFPVTYRGISIGSRSIDFLIDNPLVIELKTVDALAPVHTSQVLGYLRALHLGVGLLLNFKVEVLKYGIKRVRLSA